MTETDHYDDLQDVRLRLIDEHQKMKSYVNEGEDPQDIGIRYAEGKRDGLIEAISQVEDVLNDWNDRDDRDGSDR